MLYIISAAMDNGYVVKAIQGIIAPHYNSSSNSVPIGPQIGPSGDERSLSLVGYDKPDQLYEAIREYHVHISGKPLASTPSFGGNSCLMEANDAAFGGASLGSSINTEISSSRGRAAQIATILGESIFRTEFEDIFEILLDLDGEAIIKVLNILNIPPGGIMGRDRDNVLITQVIPAIASLRSAYETKTMERFDQQSQARNGIASSMREAKAAHEMHLLRSKAISALSEHHYNTRLTRRVLQDTQQLSKAPVRLESYSVSVLQGLLDYLEDDNILIRTLTSSVLKSIGGPSSHRTRTICQDPDAEVAAILRAPNAISYNGDSMEQALGLVPLGSAIAHLMVKQFQPTENYQISNAIAGLSSLTFMDERSNLAIGPGYHRLSTLIAKVTRGGMAFNVSAVFHHLARAMSNSTNAARDSGEWRSLCFRTLKQRQFYPINTHMPREILDQAMAELRASMDTEADNMGLLMSNQPPVKSGMNSVDAVDHGGMDSLYHDDGAPGGRLERGGMDSPYHGGGASGGRLESGSMDSPYHEVSATRVRFERRGMDSPCCDEDLIRKPQSDDDDDYISNLIVKAINQQRVCPTPKCGEMIRRGTDFCAACDSFMPGTMVCRECNAPRAFKSGNDPKVCRNYGGSLACEGTQFRKPNAEDLQRAQKGAKQYEAIRRDEAKSGTHIPYTHTLKQGAAASPSKSSAISHSAKSEPADKPSPSGKGKGKGKGYYKNERAPKATRDEAAESSLIKRSMTLVSVEDADRTGVIARPYNRSGYDINGRDSSGVSAECAEGEPMVGPFEYSANGLNEKGRDIFGSIPVFPTAGQNIETARMHEEVVRAGAATEVALGGTQGSINAIDATEAVSREIIFRVPIWLFTSSQINRTIYSQYATLKRPGCGFTA